VGISYLPEAYADLFAHVSGRPTSAIPDLQQQEVACGASKKGAEKGAQTLENTRILNLCAQGIGLLSLAANFGLYHSTCLRAGTGSDGVARNTTARAVFIDCFPQAVELPE
jgi:hypothetical protein